MSLPFVPVFVVSVAAIMIFQLLAWKRRAMGDPNDLLVRIQRRQEALIPFFEEVERVVDDDALWAAMGGVRGLLQLPRDASAVLSLFASLSLKDHDPKEYRLNVQRTEIIVVSLGGCVIDAIFRRILPQMPRTYLRVAAGQYCAICLSLQTLVSVYRPDMIERLEESL